MKQCVLFLLMTLIIKTANSQISYGLNEKAGKFLSIKGTNIYYETYGNGMPLLLLHGDVFGYIDEFAPFIPDLSKYFKVIAIATRGHGKSEIGDQPFSYRLFAQDAMAVLKQEAADSAIVVGFSAGAITGYYLAANYPKNIKKLVAIAGALTTKDYRPEVLPELRNMNIDSLEKQYPDFIRSRKKLMVEPQRYQELINRLKGTWFQGNYIEPSVATDIQCPVLTVGGDRDDYFAVDNFVSIYKKITRSQLAIIPNANHVDLLRRRSVFIDIIIPFLRSR